MSTNLGRMMGLLLVTFKLPCIYKYLMKPWRHDSLPGYLIKQEIKSYFLFIFIMNCEGQAKAFY
jgi:hypothetical protein